MRKIKIPASRDQKRLHRRPGLLIWCLHKGCDISNSANVKEHEVFKFPEGADESLLQRIMPLDTFRPPEDAASVVAFLGSDDSIHINGAALRVDGGMLA